MSDDLKSLNELKEKIINELTGLTENVDLPAEQRFNIMLSAAALRGEHHLFSKAYEAAAAIEDPSAKMDALLDLLEEIDIQIQPELAPQPTENQPEDN